MRITCIFFFSLLSILLFLYMGLVTIINIHCTYLFLFFLFFYFFYVDVCFFHLPLHVLFLFSLYAHASYYLYAI